MKNFNLIPFHLGLEKPNNMVLLYDRSPLQKNFYLHRHTNFEILILLEGDAEMVIEGKTYRLRENELIVIPEGREHYLHLMGDSPYKRIILYFSLEKLRVLGLESFANTLELCEPYTANINGTPFLLTMPEASRIAVTKINRESQTALFCERILSLYISLISLPEKKSEKASDALVERAIEYINTHLTEEISIESIADALHISGSYMCKIFKNKIGIAPMHYVMRERVLRAKKLIYDNVPLGEVCSLCGFENYPTFFRAFKRETGQSPSDYAREL